MRAGRARRTAARGGTQAALNPPEVPAASSPPPAITGTRPDAGRRRSACHFELVLTASAPASLTCGGVGVFLAASGAGNLAGPAPRRRRGEMRGGRGGSASAPQRPHPSPRSGLSSPPGSGQRNRSSASGSGRQLFTWRLKPKVGGAIFCTERQGAWLRTGRRHVCVRRGGVAQSGAAPRTESPGLRPGVRLRMRAVGEEREVEEVRLQASEGKGQVAQPRRDSQLPGPGFQMWWGRDCLEAAPWKPFYPQPVAVKQRT
ncbi:uncharacterized protein LOC102419534 isoform X1 [Myotis lucifugus]|uniref:uncharacterized protein LOC102419534 isoform X1 n=1 Tax=Myotis lucifugus TaxID=59463 RepID=UPI000CCC5BE1|nr:uncharacterized protein LOC102419534 isoform X1 [Myotis lucifugus]